VYPAGIILPQITKIFRSGIAGIILSFWVPA